MLCNPTRPDLQLTNLFVVISGKNKGAGCGGTLRHYFNLKNRGLTDTVVCMFNVEISNLLRPQNHVPASQNQDSHVSSTIDFSFEPPAQWLLIIP
jgi:hypothetical protein